MFLNFNCVISTQDDSKVRKGSEMNIVQNWQSRHYD